MPAAVLAFLAALLLSGCQTIVTPRGSDVVQRDGVLEVTEPPAPAPAICLVRARFFRGMVGVPCESIAREIRP
jgi:hypothetical protein